MRSVTTKKAVMAKESVVPSRIPPLYGAGSVGGLDGASDMLDSVSEGGDRTKEQSYSISPRAAENIVTYSAPSGHKRKSCNGRWRRALGCHKAVILLMRTGFVLL